MEHTLLVGGFPIETPLKRVNFQLPRLIAGGYLRNSPTASHPVGQASQLVGG